MPRRLNESFRCSPLQDLLGQLVRAPAARRRAQVLRLEALHDRIEAERAYPLDFIVFQITGYRRDDGETTLLLGDALQPDLRLMIDALSRITPMPAAEDEPVLRPRELATRWSVSLKTLDRYRRIGLRWRWQAEDGDKSLTVYPLRAVEAFERVQGERLAQAGAHGRWSGPELDAAVARGLRLHGRCGATANRLARFVAGRLGRPSETLRRRLVKAIEQETQAKDKRTLNVDRVQRLVRRASGWGVSAERIAQRVGRSRSSVYRMLQAERARAALGRRIEHAAGATPLPEGAATPEAVYQQTVTRSPGMIAAWPEELVSVFRGPVLTRTSEQALLVHLHRLLATAAEVQRSLDPARPRTGDLDRFDRILLDVKGLRRTLLRAQPARLLTLASQHLSVSEEAGAQDLAELLELALVDLEAALAAYDPFHPTAASPVPFERYLRLRLQRHFASASAGAAEGSARARRRAAEQERIERLAERCKSLSLMD